MASRVFTWCLSFDAVSSMDCDTATLDTFRTTVVTFVDGISCRNAKRCNSTVMTDDETHTSPRVNRSARSRLNAACSGSSTRRFTIAELSTYSRFTTDLHPVRPVPRARAGRCVREVLDERRESLARFVPLRAVAGTGCREAERSWRSCGRAR